LQWAGGRIVREYSALLDPPGSDIPPLIADTPPPVAAAPATKPITRPAPAPKEPASVPTPAPAAPAATAPSAPTEPVTPRGNEYTVKPGDTMGRIAASMKPDGVSLEQALMGIFRGNPDAFINNNVNLVRSGKILRVPEKEQMAAIPQAEATRELRVQTENWKLISSESGGRGGTCC
jgi:pilus assembly protein FimV